MRRASCKVGDLVMVGLISISSPSHLRHGGGPRVLGGKVDDLFMRIVDVL